MNIINFYTYALKNKINYNLIFSDIDQIFPHILNLSYYDLKKNIYIYSNILKFYFLENGFYAIFFKNWFKFGLKYNIIFELLI